MRVITETYPRSMGLLLLSLGLGSAAGIFLGTTAALSRRAGVSLSTLGISILGISAPAFFLLVFLQAMVVNVMTATGIRLGPVGRFGWDDHLILPDVVLAARPTAQLARVTSVTLTNIMEQDYIRTALTKGLSTNQVFHHHALKNAAIPILTAAGVSLRFSLSTLPVVERYKKRQAASGDCPRRPFVLHWIPTGGDAMIAIASVNGRVGIAEAMRVLRDGGSAVDAVETGIRLVEANPHDHTVGVGGYPNLLGQVELDASIMDGRDLTAGAVGAIRGYKHPISVARKVMEHLTHVLLVREGAERFAAEMGFERCDLLTEEACQVWEQCLLADMPPEIVARLAEQPDLWRWVEMATDPERLEELVRFFTTDPAPAADTVTLIAQDARGNICAGASTSGWAWKYPGRLGDSPIIGAGVYADDRYGAATCTGMGEMAIRASTARSVVLYLQMGLPLAEAGRRAMKDLDDLGGRYLSRMNFIAMDRDGQHAGFSNAVDRTYVYLTDDMTEPEEMPYTFVQTKQRWGEREPLGQ